MILGNFISPTRLDDGQVIKGRLSDLAREQIISLANQYRRNKQKSVADDLMRYQHEKFTSLKDQS